MYVGGHQRHPNEILALIYFFPPLGQIVKSLDEVAADLPQVTLTIAYSWKYSAIVCSSSVITAVSQRKHCWSKGRSTSLCGRRSRQSGVNSEVLLSGVAWFFPPGNQEGSSLSTLVGELSLVKSWSPSWWKPQCACDWHTGGEGGREGVGWSGPALLESGWGVGLRSGRKTPPFSCIRLSGRRGLTPSSAQVQPTLSHAGWVGSGAWQHQEVVGQINGLQASGSANSDWSVCCWWRWSAATCWLADGGGADSAGAPFQSFSVASGGSEEAQSCQRNQGLKESRKWTWVFIMTCLSRLRIRVWDAFKDLVGLLAC